MHTIDKHHSFSYPHGFYPLCTELDQQQLATLFEGHYLKQRENILVPGATGCSKSYLACALGYQARQMGMKTTYFGMNRFIEKITLSKLEAPT